MTARRAVLARAALLASAVVLIAGGAVHAVAFPGAAAAAARSTLPQFFAGAFRGLWLGDSVTSVLLGLTFAVLAIAPQLASRTVILLLGLQPLGLAVILFSTMGDFPPGYLMSFAGLAAIAASGLRPAAPTAG
jgi:hypothetical protein